MKLKTVIIFSLSIISYIYLSQAQTIDFNDINLGIEKKISSEPVQVEISKETKNKDVLLIYLKLKMNKNIHIYASDSLFFKVFIDSSIGLGKTNIVLPSHIMFKNFDKSVVPVFVDGHTIKIESELKEKNWFINGILRFQACDTAMCFTPVTMRFKASYDGVLSISKEDFMVSSENEITNDEIFNLLEKFTVSGKAGGYLDKRSFSNFLKNPKSNKKDGFESKNLFIIILLILIGGVALNFTPCVLPIIPITLSIIGAGTKAQNKLTGFLSGGLYGLAMAISYGILGVIVIISGTQFGIINSSPLFNIIISIIFLIMSLALFDLFQIDFSRFRSGGSNIIEKSKYIGIFIMGIFTSILAGACVAPVVISVILYAATLYSNGNLIALFLPFLLGIGMALPWPLAGAGLASLPKPGNWMVWVKKIFGVVILIVAVYYGYSGIESYLIRSKVDNINNPNKKDEIMWVSSLSQALNVGLIENKPVFIDFWASWCKNCKAMDATTLKDPEVIDLLKKYICVKYIAENPKEELTAKILNYFKIIGLPSYVVLEKRE